MWRAVGGRARRLRLCIEGGGCRDEAQVRRRFVSPDAVSSSLAAVLQRSSSVANVHAEGVVYGIRSVCQVQYFRLEPKVAARVPLELKILKKPSSPADAQSVAHVDTCSCGIKSLQLGKLVPSLSL